MTGGFDSDSERIQVAAKEISRELSKYVTGLVPAYAESHKLSGDETASALAMAYTMNLIGALVVGYGLPRDPDTHAWLKKEIEDVINRLIDEAGRGSSI